MMAGPDFFETKFTIRDVLSRTFLTFVPGGLADFVPEIVVRFEYQHGVFYRHL